MISSQWLSECVRLCFWRSSVIEFRTQRNLYRYRPPVHVCVNACPAWNWGLRFKVMVVVLICVSGTICFKIMYVHYAAGLWDLILIGEKSFEIRQQAEVTHQYPTMIWSGWCRVGFVCMLSDRQTIPTRMKICISLEYTQSEVIYGIDPVRESSWSPVEQ